MKHRASRTVVALATFLACASPSSSATRLHGAGTQVFPAGWLVTGELLVTVQERDGRPRMLALSRDGRVTRSIAGPSLQTWASDPHPTAERFLAESYANGVSDLYVVDLAGAGVRRLTETPWNEWHPAWSPDGRTIVLDADSATRTPRLVLLDAESGERTFPTTAPAAEQGGSWSPNGATLAFHRLMRGGSNDYDVVLLDIASGRERMLTSGGDDSSSPSWSPDGSRIAFVSNRSGTYQIYVMCANGEGTPVRLDGPEEASRYPKWSRDGAKIAFQVVNDGVWVAGPPGNQACAAPATQSPKG